MKACFSVAMLALAFPLCSAQVVDRMVAVVNRHVVLQSELEQEVRVDFMLRGLPLARITGAEMEAMLERLIDQSLVQQQIVDSAIIEPKPEELAESLTRTRAALPGGQDEEQWKALLTTYGLSQQDVEVHIASQLKLLRFIDLRFRSLARADRAAVVAYYQQQYLPERKKQGLSEPPLNEVYGQIEKILVEQRIDELLSAWLATLRTQTGVQKLTPVSGLSSGAQP